MVGGLAGLVGEDDADDEERGGEGGEHGADPELDPAPAGDLARLDPALGAEAAHGAEQREDDRDDDDRRGDEADPKQGVDLVSARRVRASRRGHSNHVERRTRPCGSPARIRPDAALDAYLYSPRLMRRRPRPSPALRLAVRAGAARSGGRRHRGAAAAQAAADSGPGDDRRLRRGPAGAGRPRPALEASATSPSSRCRCGPSAVVHEMPYDDPERLRAPPPQPLSDRRRPGDRRSASCPTPACSARSRGCPGSAIVNRFLTWAHWLWFFEPYLALALILVRDHDRFPRAARQMAAVFDLGCAVYFAVPTAPPWWASEQGLTGDEEVRRIMVEVGEETWGRAWPTMYKALGGNPWAAMPSLHFATSVMAAISLSEAGQVEGALGWTYAGTLGFALVYLGEHYVTDLIAGGGAGRRWCRRGEPLAEPLVIGVNGACSAWSASPAGSFPGGVWRALGERRTATAEMPVFTTRRIVQTRVVVAGPAGRDLLPLPEAGRPRRRAGQARRRRPALDRGRDRLQRRSPTRPTSPSSKRWSAATRCASAGARPTRSTWPGWRRRCSSRPAAPAASRSPTGRCARRGWGAATSPAGWSPSSPSTTPSTRWR